MFGIGHTELLILLAIILLLFGGSRIPSLARSLGKSITEFKRGVQGIDDAGATDGEVKKTESESAK